MNTTEEKTLAYDLDPAGIEQRAAEAVELVDLRAKVAELEGGQILNRKAIARKDARIAELEAERADIVDACGFEHDDDPKAPNTLVEYVRETQAFAVNTMETWTDDDKDAAVRRLSRNSDTLRRKNAELELLVGEGDALRTRLRRSNEGLRARVVELESDKMAMIDDARRIENASRCPGDVDMLDHVELLALDSADLRSRITELEAEAERLRDANRLRPMSEAPIDGTEFAVLVPLHAVGNDMYFRDRWCGEYGPIEGDGSWDEWTPGWLPMPESETKA